MAEAIAPIKEGEPAPDFILAASNGDELSLNYFTGKPLVLFFYAKNTAPDGIKLVCEFRDHHQEFIAIGARVVGVGVESLDSINKFIAKYRIPFLLLCDTDMKITRKYGVFRPRDVEGVKVWGIERTTFIIDEQSRIIKIINQPEVPGHCESVLQIIKEMKK
ncbi:MAG TPA: peroxiredoxin [Candidatus Sumerlaeota bacterium]|nr:MAG: putative peroxiredoxin bcp [candidate division BRC1 bacterium ADurb.Bin183]HOE62837.1 peroxiredoxin [Candidatus Sumerlaeota bacterium]HRR31028.1 peroxiredoxin [Candidatus Sumerlaeia bacterium]HON50187.1 peroxiredoxin [Candidatus Sumerlaeota bacterium]HOR63403.1 peroxiredoxin [Candidatus Sumerlaeota bacterium]